jgi:hypothetical protein
VKKGLDVVIFIGIGINSKDKNMTAKCFFLLTQHSNFAKNCKRTVKKRQLPVVFRLEG